MCYCAKQHFQGGRGPTDDHPDPLPAVQPAAAVMHHLMPEQDMDSSHSDNTAGIFQLSL